MTDDLPFLTPEPDPSRPERPPRKCIRHDWTVLLDQHADRDADPTGYMCLRCGRVRDEAAARRNRNNAKRGKRIQRQRIVGLGGQNLPGNKPNHDGIGVRFSYESKSGASAFSERYWRWLKGIPRNADQAGVLIVTDTPGPGHKARAYVVVEYDDWRDEHGEQEEAS